MKLGFDLDGCLVDFTSAFIDRIVSVTGEDKFPPRPFDVPCWDYPAHFGYTPEQVDAVWDDITADSLFWMSLSPLAGEQNTVQRIKGLTPEHDVYFITARPGRNAKRQSEIWLRWYGFDDPTVLISGHKGLACKALELDLYVDDKRENCDSVHFDSKTRVFIYDQPWNREGQDFYSRVRSIDEMLARVE